MFEVQSFEISGKLIRNGFWLYVLEFIFADERGNDDSFLYVGRTGDNSTSNARPPINRFSIHMSSNKNSKLNEVIAKYNRSREDCSKVKLHSVGPIYPESSGEFEVHKIPRNKTSAMEKQLSVDLKNAGYNVLNIVHSKQKLPPEWTGVRAAFLKNFPKLGDVE